jgi:restriction system protein
MARTKKTSPAEDLLVLIALLPWWAGVGLAILCYGVLHALAAPVTAPIAQPGQMGQYVARMLFKSLAYYGQFIVPVICLAGAALSAWRCRQRRTLVAKVTQNPTASVLDGLSWREFEQFVAEGFRLQGYEVIETGGSGADGGVDLILNKGGDKFFVQCKQWKAYKVGVGVVRELYGVMAAKGAAGGFVVTSGRFTEPAREFANGRNLKLVDGPLLLRLLQQAQAVHHRKAPMITAPAAPARTETDSAIPTCQTCTKPMVRRMAKRGGQAGIAFRGCAGYPACKGTRPIS